MDYPMLKDDYDVAAPQIKCNADKLGARIFLVPVINGIGDDVRVLAFDSKTAAYCGRQYSLERAIAHRMAPPLSAAEVMAVLEVVED